MGAALGRPLAARRCQEAEDCNEDMDGGMAGFVDILRPLIEKQMLREILGGGALKQMVAGMLATSSAGPSVIFAGDEAVQAKGKGKSKGGDEGTWWQEGPLAAPLAPTRVRRLWMVAMLSP